MMAQITAVEWLVNQIQNRQNGIVDSLPVLSTDKLYHKAKQMENEQRNKDLKTGYNQGYIDAQCNHINDADNFTHEYLNH